MLTLMATLLTSLAPERSSARLIAFDSAPDFIGFTSDRAEWSEAARGFVAVAGGEVAAVVSPSIPVSDGFDSAIVSWNADTPGRSRVVLKLSARVDQQWTQWYNLGLWHSGGCELPRTSFRDQDDDLGRVDTDILVLKRRASEVRVRVDLHSDGVFSPTLRFLSLCLSKGDPAASDEAARSSAWGRELDVPQLCQLSVPEGRPWCSPTSVAMVLGYWSRKLDRPDLTVTIPEVARAVYDEAWGGTGNWTFNTAYAGSHVGIRAYVTRLESMVHLEQLISAGFPVVLSLDYNKLNRRATDRTMGHLVVARGFTRAGNVIINDPWAHLDKGETVRKIVARADVQNAWFGPSSSHGTVYLVHPHDLQPPLH